MYNRFSLGTLVKAARHASSNPQELIAEIIQSAAEAPNYLVSPNADTRNGRHYHIMPVGEVARSCQIPVYNARRGEFVLHAPTKLTQGQCLRASNIIVNWAANPLTTSDLTRLVEDVADALASDKCTVE